MLEDTQPIYDLLVDLADRIDANWQSISLPPSVKIDFAKLWKSKIHYTAEISVGQIKLFTSPNKAEYVADVALAKAICGYPLRQALHAYRDIAVTLASSTPITTFEDEFKGTNKTQPPSWKEWEGAIKSSDLSEVEKVRFAKFLCDSESFHEIKGIHREDFAAPALIKALGHRVDRFGIAEQIAFATDQTLYDAVFAFVNQKASGGITTVSVNSLRQDFQTALVEIGFAP